MHLLLLYIQYVVQLLVHFQLNKYSYYYITNIIAIRKKMR